MFLQFLLQFWQHLFLFFALSALWFFTLRGLRDVISAATCRQETYLLSAFPNPPTSVPITSDRSTMDTFSLVKLEFAISGIIQLLLVMSGIETNPGPPAPPNSSCCNANQHFNRVKRVIADAPRNFRTKLVPGTLTKVVPDNLTQAVIEIHEAGEQA